MKMGQCFINKRFLVTDYYLREPEIYKDVISILTQQGAIVFTLLNEKTFKGDFVNIFPKCIPILLNTCRFYEENADGTKKDKNKIKFEQGPERYLMDNLPSVDHVINFAGPEFVKIFKEKPCRYRYRIVDTKFGTLKSKLIDSTLIPAKCLHAVIHIVPDTIFQCLASQDGIRHYVNFNPKKTNTPEMSTSIENLASSISNIASFSRFTIFRRSLSIRIRQSFVNMSASNISEEKQQLRKEEVDKLRKRLKDITSKSIRAYDKKLSNMMKNHKKEKEKLNKKVKLLISSDKAKFLEEHERDKARSGIYYSEGTKRLMDKSINIKAEKHAIKLSELTFKSESQRLDNKLESVLSDFRQSWYNNTLNDQAKIIYKTTKTYVEKMKAAEIAFNK